MPVARRVVVEFLTDTDAPDVIAYPMLVQKLNQLAWRSSRRQIAGHPATDLGRALGASRA